jgi:23S rRNA (guanosine2251-2'-O)-methyltransferase
MIHSKVYIYGKHAVSEALMSTPNAIEEIFLAQQFDDQKVRDLIKKANIRTSVLNGGKMPREVDMSGAHQGIIALLYIDRLIIPFEDFSSKIKIDNDTSVVVLGELSDPQNVGAVIRSAAAFGISAVLIPEHNQAQITGSVVKVSAGMVFKVPIISISNVNSALRELKDLGFAVYGLTGDARFTITKEEFELPTAFVLGNEAEGIREKTQELCDKLLSIPMNPNCESLNAAAAATVALYAWSTKHSKALKS